MLDLLNYVKELLFEAWQMREELEKAARVKSRGE
jgi:hypothetical protein